MSNNINIQDIELKRLVNRYFEGKTTVAEEQRLRRLLAQSDDMSEDVEAARAVMGIFATARLSRLSQASQTGQTSRTGQTRPTCPTRPTSPTSKTGRGRRRGMTPLWAAVSVAASVAILFAIVMKLSVGGNLLDGRSEQLANQHGLRHGDSIAMLAAGEGSAASYRSIAVSRGNVHHIDDEDDIANLINTEMGYMAEAERSVEQSVAAEFNSLSGILQ